MIHGKIDTYYPAYINLRNKKVLVFGGGKIAERKVCSLIKFGADNITVISPTITGKLEKELKKGRIKHIPRNFIRNDLKNAFLVIAATNDKSINKKIAREADCLVNVVDTPELCNFIVPSTIKRGALTIAISTCGTSPALSKTIRKELERQFGKEYSDFTRFLYFIREKAKKEIKDNCIRNTFLRSVASKDILQLLKNSCLKEAKELILKNLQKISKG